MQNVRGPFLIVAPLSTVVNWQREVTLWTDFDVILYHGNKDDRDIARDFDFFYTQHKDTNKKSKAQSGYKIQVVITTPETCLLSDDPKSPRPSKELSNIYWDMLVVDEAHKLKNYNSRITVTLREEFKYSNTLLLTGTPLQNNVEELWTLLNFVDNQYFNSLESFIYDFGDLKESKQLVKLQGHLGPYLLKREKENVETSVPPKEEVIIEVELTAPQKQYYRALYENNKTFLCRSNSGSKHNGPSLTNLAMELRKCCNHPFLIRGAEEELMKHFKQKIKNENLKALEDEKSDVKPLTKSMRESMEQECIVQASGKLILLDKLLPKLQADGHKVLIFSQFRIMLDVLQDYIELRQFSFERIDGAITGKRRQQAIDKYSAPGSQIFVMLLSTRAGGVGINLTAADTVLIFDSDWNPQNDIQAQARAHRIGQTKPVKVYRLLTRKTYEMQMFQSASLKLGLDYAIMHNTGKNAHALISPTKQISKKPLPNESLSLSNKEIEGLLKYGAYDMFREEKEGISDQASTNFNNSDIDSILARSTVIVHDSNNVSSNPGKKLPNFSTASFVANDEQTVDIDDPDFWTKVVGLTVDEDEVVKLGKRKCREKSYINYADNGFNFKTNIYRDESSDSDSVVESNSDEEHVLEVDDVVNSQDSNNGSNPINEAKSEDSNTEVKRRRRQTKRQNLKVPEIVPAVWSFENVAKLSTTLLDTGYGNWEKIRHRSKLNFPLYDIALGKYKIRYVLGTAFEVYSNILYIVHIVDTKAVDM
jgi:chromodomain-helicase-DNA-binding protein 7